MTVASGRRMHRRRCGLRAIAPVADPLRERILPALAVLLLRAVPHIGLAGGRPGADRKNRTEGGNGVCQTPHVNLLGVYAAAMLGPRPATHKLHINTMKSRKFPHCIRGKMRPSAARPFRGGSGTLSL